jgi:hypothetical protein
MDRLIHRSKRVISFLQRYQKYPLFIPIYGITYFLKGFSLHAHFLTNEEVVEELKKGKSIIRLGDGDIVNIQLDMDNCYHKPSERLKEMYRTIIMSYSKKSPYMLSVPIFINKTNKELKALGPRKLEWGLPMKIMFLLQFNRKAPYMDAHSFYYDNYFESVVAPLFLNKKVIFIANGKTIEKQKANEKLPWKDAIFIESPATDAMDAYESIQEKLDNALATIGKENAVIFFAMGPVGKGMAYEYAHKGYQSIDIGKVCEVMFTGESIQYLI